MRWITTATVALTVLGCAKDVTAPEIMPTAARRSELPPAPILERFFGPERFVRTRGAPDEFTRVISTLGFEQPFVLHVRSGAADGSRRAQAGVVTFDGNVVVSESDFGRQAEWAIPVTPARTALLGVTLRGAPDGLVEVWLEGKRSDPVFCPNGPDGTYPTLPAAIGAAAIGGTVLVCDGEHPVDLVRIRKPLTLRSQNPGGATLADVDPNPGFQTGRPALVIDSVPTGLVRLVDLNFVVRGRAILVGGLFDQVVIDSARFSGRNVITSFGVYVASTGSASAKVEITRSHFASLQTGVFPTRAVETNVSHSTFENMGGGSITYSGALVTSGRSASFGRAEHNAFTRCSVNGCIRIVGVPAIREVVIAHNKMTRPSGPTQSAAIFVSRISGIPIIPGAPIIIENNETSGAVLGTGPSSHFQEWWSVGSFVNNVGGAGGNPVVIRNNRVTDHYVGVSASAPVTVHDNHFMSGHRAIMQFNNAVAVDFQRNDVYFEMSIWRAQAGGNAGNYRCNWWGSSSGPAHPTQNVPASAYTPWATQPLAGTSLPCDGTGAPAPPPSVVRVCSVALAEGPPTFSTVSAAYDAVTTAGTILICDGTHVVRDVGIGRAVTIRGEGPGKPVLDAQGARSNFDIRDVAGGAVVLRGLQLKGTWVSTHELPRQGYGANVAISGSYTTITVDNADFYPSGPPAPPADLQYRSANSGVWIWDAVGNGITVRNSTFTGGDIGVGGSGTSLVVESNVFRGQLNGAVNRGPSGGATVVQDNEISDCGPEWCIIAQALDALPISVLRNRITLDGPVQTRSAILFGARQATAIGNVITGIGGARIDRSTFPILYGISAHTASTEATNYRTAENTISGAYSGIDFASSTNVGSGFVFAEARDNRITGVFTPFSGSGGIGFVSVKLHRNDFTSHAVADPDIRGENFRSIELSCNWWGSADGPTGYFPSTWVTLVQPVATEPIAGRIDVACP